jgi:hypothetical protein
MAAVVCSYGLPQKMTLIILLLGTPSLPSLVAAIVTSGEGRRVDGSSAGYDSVQLSGWVRQDGA